WTSDFFIQLDALEQEQERLSHPYLRKKVMNYIQESYLAASNPILFLDFDGTLVPLEKNPQNVRLPDDVKRTILAITDRSKVVIVSGRDRQFLEREVGDLPVPILAEHGALIKNRDHGQWEHSYPNQDEWKEIIRPI